MDTNKFFEPCGEWDMEYLKEVCEMYQEILSTQHIILPDNMNILHIAVICGNEELVTQVGNRLPIRLLLQPDNDGYTPLHYCKSLKIAVILIDAYKNAYSSVIDQELNAPDNMSCPPWRVKSRNDLFPVHIAAWEGNEDLALHLLSEEPDFLHYFDKREISKLFAAATESGCKNIVTTILESDVSLEFNAEHIKTLARRWGESLAVLMIQREPDTIKGTPTACNLIFYAAEQNMVELIKAILDADISLSVIYDDDGYNFLHVAASYGHVDIARVLVDKLYQHYSKHQALGTPEYFTKKAWRQKVCRTDFYKMHDYRPHHLAILERHEEFAAFLLLVDPDLLSQDDMFDRWSILGPAESSLSLAVKWGMKQLVEQIILSGVQYSTAFDMKMIIQFYNEFPKYLTKELIKQHPELLDFIDVYRRTHMSCYALEEDNAGVIPLLLEISPSIINNEPSGDKNLLIRACSMGNFDVICAIGRRCPDQAREIRGDHDTIALHHVKHHSLEQCQELLTIPAIAYHKNKIDEHRRTPLIKAIQEGYLFLAKALVKMDGIDVMNIKNGDQRCAADMLKEKSIESSDWESVYKDIRTMTSYIPPGTNLGEVRNTLSLVAALLATITFAAAFTVPGGFDQNTGDVLLGKKVSFWAFLISDTYAMCCSMIVLYSLVWTMAWDPNKALVYIDRSVIALQHSLYGTLVAFVTGVYTMEAKKAFWLVIVVIVMCTSIPVSRIYVKVHDKVVSYSKCKSTPPQSTEELNLISVQS